MNPTPKGWPRMSAALFYDRPAEAIDWLCKALGFELRLKVDGEGGAIVHSELTFGEAVLMVSGSGKDSGDANKRAYRVAAEAGGVTGSLMLYVDDVDAHCARATAAGAKLLAPVELHDYGEEYWADRSYGLIDVGGHQWWISQRVRG